MSLTQVFKTKYTQQIALLCAISLLLWFPAILYPSAMPTFNFFIPFYESIRSILHFAPWLCVVLSFLLVILEGFYLNHILVHHGLSSKMSLLPAFLYILFMSCDAALLTLHPILTGNLFVLLMLNGVLCCYASPRPYETIFNTSFFAICAGLSYPPLFFLFPLLFIAFLVYRLYDWRVWLLTIFGGLTPFSFLLSYYYLTDTLWENAVFLQQSLVSISAFSIREPSFTATFLYVGIAVFLLFSVYYFGQHLRDKGLSYRKKSTVLIYAILLALLAALYPSNTTMKIMLLSPILSFFYSTFLLGKRKPFFANAYWIIFLTFVLGYATLQFLQARAIFT